MARDYIQATVKTSNKSHFELLKKLIDRGQFEAQSFEDSNLDILTFDWQNLERDRNWWWQLQALPFLSWYINSFSLQSKEEQKIYFAACLDAVHNWIDKAKQNKESPLVWHDHAAAFRIRNLTNWLVFCRHYNLPLDNEPRVEALGDLIIEHLDWLQEDKHYSKHTNHGFDQAMIALIISSMFSFDGSEDYRRLNRKRLKEEVAFAFTNEGVHKENSPSYQKMMFSRLQQLRTLALLGDKEISNMSDQFVAKVEAFLRAITLPNGLLPMIGDTRGDDEGLVYEQKQQIDVLDYSASGYVIVRGDVVGKDFHLVFKASHLSHYHRHDDDLSIHLYFDGKVLLGDGGLGYYNERCEKRKALRSCTAHNVPYIIGSEAVRKVEDLRGSPPTVTMNGKTIIGKTHCFGTEVTRELDLSRLRDGKITIKDIAGGDSETLAVNFFSSEGLYHAEGCLFVPIHADRALKVDMLSEVNIKENSNLISKEFSKFATASSCTLTSSKRKSKAIEFELDLNTRIDVNRTGLANSAHPHERKSNGSKSTFTLEVDGFQYAMVLPHWETDYIQGMLAEKAMPYELPMLRTMRQLLTRGDLVLDIGANIGNHTLYLAAATGCNVIAFEPNPILATPLQRSIDLNDLGERVSLIAKGVGSEEAKGVFKVSKPDNLGAQMLTLIDTANESDSEGRAVDVVPLDSMSFASRVKAIKVDVEGMELDVLRGARELIARDQPSLFIESQNEAEFAKIHEFLEPWGYVYWRTFNATPTNWFVPKHLASRADLQQNGLEQGTAFYKLWDERQRLRKSNLELQEKCKTANRRLTDIQKILDEPTTSTSAKNR
ncbi:FkbM family methyltransferase [Pseudovibrio exalbescens]|uniref:FkbM family methyltransferase n=1 Tax=Pseudovibrio exalbescens TaxID=197461 RepID=UPI002365D53C|nr:FkbM family methyltransferase [Pseudovibrio exalbescens]MDD7911503.1 FkbM family methyltransferase [Pseudovibrio exalbescens]